MFLGAALGSHFGPMWSLLGCKGVDVLAWENFGKDWVIDVLEQLKIKSNKLSLIIYYFRGRYNTLFEIN